MTSSSFWTNPWKASRSRSTSARWSSRSATIFVMLESCFVQFSKVWETNSLTGTISRRLSQVCSWM